MSRVLEFILVVGMLMIYLAAVGRCSYKEGYTDGYQNRIQYEKGEEYK